MVDCACYHTTLLAVRTHSYSKYEENSSVYTVSLSRVFRFTSVPRSFPVCILLDCSSAVFGLLVNVPHRKPRNQVWYRSFVHYRVIKIGISFFHLCVFFESALTLFFFHTLSFFCFLELSCGFPLLLMSRILFYEFSFSRWLALRGDCPFSLHYLILLRFLVEQRISQDGTRHDIWQIKALHVFTWCQVELYKSHNCDTAAVAWQGSWYRLGGRRASDSRTASREMDISFDWCAEGAVSKR